MTDYLAVGGFIVSPKYESHQEYVCTVPQAAQAYVHMAKGPAICKDRGHDYSEKVVGTSNMYLCFRCGEPGWEVPYLDEAQSTEAGE